MYITAHLVESKDQREGINAFLHVHGNRFLWPDDASSLPDTTPGKTVLHRTDLPPGGNKVRAYLDILVPDRTPREEIEQALKDFSRDLRERRNPTVFNQGVVTIRFGVELALEALRAQQLEMLTHPALQLLEEHIAAQP
jgi:hypothetical protein